MNPKKRFFGLSECGKMDSRSNEQGRKAQNMLLFYQERLSGGYSS